MSWLDEIDKEKARQQEVRKQQEAKEQAEKLAVTRAYDKEVQKVDEMVKRLLKELSQKLYGRVFQVVRTDDYWRSGGALTTWQFDVPHDERRRKPCVTLTLWRKPPGFYVETHGTVKRDLFTASDDIGGPSETALRNLLLQFVGWYYNNSFDQ
jgi:hypothetical protein